MCKLGPPKINSSKNEADKFQTRMFKIPPCNNNNKNKTTTTDNCQNQKVRYGLPPHNNNNNKQRNAKLKCFEILPYLGVSVSLGTAKTQLCVYSAAALTEFSGFFEGKCLRVKVDHKARGNHATDPRMF